MDRLLALKEKGLDEQEWQKIYYKNQKQYIRRRLEAIKYLCDGMTRSKVT